MKNIIHAISFLHKGKRVIVKATNSGKFKVPVTDVTNGQLNTKMKNLTAKQVIEHDIIKNCDPTFYLENNERLRVYPGGDSTYLPAHVDGLAQKHDIANKPKPPFVKKKILDNLNTNDYYDRYHQADLDTYGWWPDYQEDGNAD
tara:strand:+ start:135 stop:566 length:432 start_codon:yes stop_codon:yes gene_type:complete